MNGKEDILDIEQASDLLRLSKTTVYKMVKEGKLPHRKLGKQIRFSREVLQNFIKTGEPGTPERE